MVGTILNTVAICAGGVVGLTVAKDFSAATQLRIKFLLGALIVFAGLSTVWGAISGSFGSILKQFVIVMLALLLGNATGKLLRLQKRLNLLGQYAKERLAARGTASARNLSEGFITCSLLFCVGPMAILGALEDGLNGQFRTLAIKSALDGLATMAFAKVFGWGVLLSALPVLAYQGTITLGAKALQPMLEDQALLSSINATGGFLVAFIALIVLDVKKVPLADYLPSLVFAPLLTVLWR